ncbi:hypothetical protein BB561_005950 [Smittium simulii]|uniref:Uncharacterized protein n=1 Tax=Smittium simulii TaxID=133385 RepID=A0A2T9Y7E1_9FUNG|nr:hypothetical protein BB561_005950 [Smittium simulii]
MTDNKYYKFILPVVVKIWALKNFNKFKEDSIQGFNSQDQRLTPKSVKTHKSRKNIFTWISKLCMICTSNFNSFSSRPLNAEASLRAQKQCTNKIGYMDINKRAVISARESRIRNIYRFQRHSMGNNCWLPFLFWIMDSFRGLNAYQCQGVIDYNIHTPTPECCRLLCANILRQYYNAFIRKEIWGYDFTQITRDSRKYPKILIKNKYSATSDLRTINIKSSGCSKQVNCTNEMVNVRSNIHTAKQAEQRLRLDLFASRSNAKLPTYYSWFLDPKQ